MKKLLCLFLTLCTFNTTAGELEDSLISKVTEAYGGNAIRNLQSYAVYDVFIGPSLGQSYSHDLEHVQEISQGVSRDIQGQRAVFDSLFTGRGGIFQASTIINGDNAWTVNYPQGIYGEAQNGDIYALAGGTMRTNDALLAHELWQQREHAEHLGEDTYLGNPVEKIKTPFPLSPDLVLYVDKETYRIVRMVRENPQLGRLDYTYADWTEADGIPYARETHFMVSGRPNLISTSKTVRFNQTLPDSLFEVPADFDEEPERIDTAEMSLRKLSADVFHIGQGGAFSLFARTSAGLVAAGTTAGLAGRLSHYRSETGDHQPLAYTVVTHHHSDHVPGVADAITAGARIVTTAPNHAAIDEFVDTYPASTFLDVEGRLSLGTGKTRVELYEVDTIHAARYLVVYVPAEKVVFMADHLNSPYVSGTPVINKNGLSMMQALKGLNLDVKRIVVSHGARIFKWQDFEDAVAAYGPLTCSGDRPVCR